MPKKSTKLQKLASTVNEMIEDMEKDSEFDMLFFNIMNDKIGGLTDERQQTKVKHQMSDVVGIVFFAVLSDIDEWYEMEMFAIDHRDTLKQYLPLENGIPSHDTLERVFSIIKEDELQEILVQVLKDMVMKATKEMDEPLYTNEELGIEISDIIAIDGKETRNSGKKYSVTEEERRNLNELNVQSTEYGITLSSTRINEKSNEIPEAQRVLRTLDLRKCVVTADALNTQKDTVAVIVDDAHADYCLALKANQKNAYTDIVEYFNEDTLNELKKGPYTYREEKEITSERSVTREMYISEDIRWFEDRSKWKKLKSIGYEKKTIVNLRDNKESIEERYYLCSLKADAELFSIVIRRHWHVENLLHWVLDVTFKEDALRMKEKTAMHNLGLVRRFVLSILKVLKEYYGNISYRYMRRRICRTFEKQVPIILSVLKILYDNNAESKS